MTSVIEICDEIERYAEDQHDLGYQAAVDLLDRECEEKLAEATEVARLEGFEDGYDEAKVVFQKEGIEDVKTQAWDLGFRASQAKMDDKKELWRQAGFDAGVDKGMREGFDQGRKQGRKEGRAAERLDVIVEASKEEVSDKEVEAYEKGWVDKEAETILNYQRRQGAHGC